MKETKKFVTMLLALMLALSLCGFAMAEGETDSAANTAAADALREAEDKNQALNDALTAYGKAKQEGRKQAILASLKEELDGYVAAGSMTQEQADLLLSWYADQLTQNDNGLGMGRGGRGMRNGLQNGPQNGLQNGQQNMPRNGFGRGGKHGGMNQQMPAAPGNGGSMAAPADGGNAAAPSDGGNVTAPTDGGTAEQPEGNGI